MFDDLTQTKAEKAISLLIKDGEIDKTQYAIWWKKKHISPARVITKHYELEGRPIPRRSINTDQAQKKLLELGFPIVDTTVADNFFSTKELESFQKLLARKDYNPSNKVDVNIGEFLRESVWSKTQIWAQKLEQLGWQIISSRRGWNTRNQKKGFQTFKQYAWCSLKPKDGENNLLFFTVGVDSNGNLTFKMDIQRNDKSFTQEQIDLFSNLRDQYDAGFQYINKNKASTYSWDSLVKKSDQFFTNHLSTYTDIYYSLWPERRLMRLVYNEDNWQVPMERFWKKEWQGKSDKAHHEQYGFGFEEWLFNSRYNLDGVQYGYVRGVDTMPADTTFINELYLYTLNPQTSHKYLIAKLVNVNLYRDIEDIDKDVLQIYEDGREIMLEELSMINSDTNLLKKIDLFPNISFSLEESIVYEEPILLPEDILKTVRFIPNKIQGDLENLVNQIEREFKDPKLRFNVGNGTGTNSYSQKITGGKREVNRTHADITNDLHDYLSQAKDFKGFKISTEKTRVGNNLVDCAAKAKNKHIFFEVKTSNSFLTNVRLALGQIIEYALLDKSIEVEKLIIVGPAQPKDRDLIYFEVLKEKLSLPLYYWAYSLEEDLINEKFTKY